MNALEVVLKDKKKQYKGTVKRVLLFGKAKVMEIEIPTHDSFYCLFYQNSIIYGEKLDAIEKGSFIEKASENGITIDNLHPLLGTLLPTEPINLPNKNRLFSHIQKQYSLQEVAYITTMLDSFFPKEKLIDVLDKIYYHHRRNGSYLKAYQINHLITLFDPTLTSSFERLHSREYSSFYDLYHTSPLSAIYEKDPLFTEFKCFKNRTDPSHYRFLNEHLIKEGRLLDAIYLWLEQANTDQHIRSIELFTEYALQFVSIKQWLKTLIYVGVNPFEVLPNAKKVINAMIQAGEYKEAISCLIPFMKELPPTYYEEIFDLFEKLDGTTVETYLEDFTPFLQHLIETKGVKEVEPILTQIVEKLFVENTVETLYEKLSTIRELAPKSLVMHRISNMLKLVEDPDQMMELGQYFAGFKKFDEAIECFSWEMELHPNNPEPVGAIIKMYRLKGMKEEVTTYQHLYNQLNA